MQNLEGRVNALLRVPGAEALPLSYTVQNLSRKNMLPPLNTEVLNVDPALELQTLMAIRQMDEGTAKEMLFKALMQLKSTQQVLTHALKSGQ